LGFLRGYGGCKAGGWRDLVFTVQNYCSDFSFLGLSSGVLISCSDFACRFLGFRVLLHHRLGVNIMKSNTLSTLAGFSDLGKKRIIFVTGGASGVGASTFTSFLYAWYRLVAGVEPVCLDLNWANPSLATLLPGAVVDTCGELKGTSQEFWKGTDHGGFSALSLLNKIRDTPGDLFLVDLPSSSRDYSKTEVTFSGMDSLLGKEIRVRDFAVYYPWAEMAVLTVGKGSREGFSGPKIGGFWSGSSLPKKTISDFFVSFAVCSAVVPEDEPSIFNSRGFLSALDVPLFEGSGFSGDLAKSSLVFAPFSLKRFGTQLDSILKVLNVGCESDNLLLQVRRLAVSNWNSPLLQDVLAAGDFADKWDDFFEKMSVLTPLLITPSASSSMVGSDELHYGDTQVRYHGSKVDFRFFPDISKPLSDWTGLVPVSSLMADLSPAFADALVSRRSSGAKVAVA
jgi:hypothetical protein